VHEGVISLVEMVQHGGIVGMLFSQEEDVGDLFGVLFRVFGPRFGPHDVDELVTVLFGRFDDGTFPVVVPGRHLDNISVSYGQIDRLLEGVGSKFDGESGSGPTSLLVETVETGVGHTYLGREVHISVPETVPPPYKICRLVPSALPVLQSIHEILVDPSELPFVELTPLLMLVPERQESGFGVQGGENLVPLTSIGQSLGSKIEQERSPVELNVIPFVEVVALEVLHVGRALCDLVGNPSKVQIVVFVDDGELETGSAGTVDDGLAVLLVLGVVGVLGGSGPVEEYSGDTGRLHHSQLPVDHGGVSGCVSADLGVVERGDVLLTVDDVVGVAVRHGPVDPPLAVVAVLGLEPGHHVGEDLGPADGHAALED
jgi:hypothetical protein